LDAYAACKDGAEVIVVQKKAGEAGDKASHLKKAGKKRAEFAKDTNESREDTAHKGNVKNNEGSEFDVLTNTSEFDVTKKIDSDVLRMDKFPAIGDHVKSVVEEVEDALRDTVGNAFSATKGKANEAGENLEEKTEAARKEGSARAHAAKARGEYTVDSEWAGEATNDAV
jgi:hypothetical protein